MAGFRQRFGTAFDLAPGAALAAKEMKEDAARQQQQAAGQTSTKKGKKGAAAKEEMIKAAEEKEKAAAEAAAQEAADADSFESLMASYVREQPNLRGGQVAGKGVNSKKKK